MAIGVQKQQIAGEVGEMALTIRFLLRFIGTWAENMKSTTGRLKTGPSYWLQETRVIVLR